MNGFCRGSNWRRGLCHITRLAAAMLSILPFCHTVLLSICHDQKSYAVSRRRLFSRLVTHTGLPGRVLGRHTVKCPFAGRRDRAPEARQDLGRRVAGQVQLRLRQRSGQHAALFFDNSRRSFRRHCWQAALQRRSCQNMNRRPDRKASAGS